MIAVYYFGESDPYHLCVLDVVAPTRATFRAAMKQNEYPEPNADDDILFLQNDKIVDHKLYSDLA